ncbi:MAG: GGDEF domain-containing protein [Hahellaceae bacterium]|nr:GGDEF domain-containing protein [Hahellaceae bacterium]
MPFLAQLPARLWFSLWACGLTLLSGTLLYTVHPMLPGTIAGLLTGVPMSLFTSVLFAAALLLSASFNQSRLFFMLFGAALPWATTAIPALATHFPAELGVRLLDLLPLNLCLISWLGGRGLFTRYSLLIWSFLAIEVGAVMTLASPLGLPLASMLNRLDQPLPLTLPPALTAPLYLWIYAICGSLLLLIALMRKRPTEGISLSILAAAWISRASSLPGDPELYWLAPPLLGIIALMFEAYSIAFIDALTGIPGRRALEDAGRQLGRRYLVAMADVDHFKKFNDTYGHDVGDQVLKMVASRLRSVSAGGRAYRYGGEEFTLLFRHADQPRALAELERLRLLIEHSEFALRADNRPPKAKGKPQRGSGKARQPATVKVTVSMGLATRTPAQKTLAETLKKADQALYKAKQNGRNRIECA